MSQSRMVQARRHAYDMKKTTDTGMGGLTDILKLLEDLAQASAHVKSKGNGRLEGFMQVGFRVSADKLGVDAVWSKSQAS